MHTGVQTFFYRLLIGLAIAEKYNRPLSSYSVEEALARSSAEYDGYEERYNARFQGHVIPGVGCDVCEWVCDVWDLRAMDPADFKERFREAMRLGWREKNREVIYIGYSEWLRLECMVAAHPERLLGTLKELMNPPESPLVRSKAIDAALLHRLDRPYVRRMLEQLAAEGGNYGDWARDKLEEDFDAGVPDAHAL